MPTIISLKLLFLFNNSENCKVLLTQLISLSVSEKITNRLITLSPFIKNILWINRIN